MEMDFANIKDKNIDDELFKNNKNFIRKAIKNRNFFYLILKLLNKSYN